MIRSKDGHLSIFCVIRKGNLPLAKLKGGFFLTRAYTKCTLSLLIIGVMVTRFVKDGISLLEIRFFQCRIPLNIKLNITEPFHEVRFSMGKEYTLFRI